MRLTERPVAFVLTSASCVAPTSNAPLPCSVRKSAVCAVFVTSTQLTAIAAATPTLPDEFPDSLCELLLPLSTCDCWVGMLPVFPLVLLLPDTCPLLCLSELLPVLPSFAWPFALAWTSDSMSTVDVDLIEIAPTT